MGYAIEKTATFDRWMKELRDRRAALAINKRLTRIVLGNFGDCKWVGEGVFGLRIDVGQGYRVYCTIQQGKVVVLLCGGDKSGQEADIGHAAKMARTLEK